jgi:hypothetical protein
MLATRAAMAVAGARARDRLAHDAANGAGATAALWAAAEATEELSGSAWLAGMVDRAAHVTIGQHVAGTDDHRQRGRRLVRFDYSDACQQANGKDGFYTISNLPPQDVRSWLHQ